MNKKRWIVVIVIALVAVLGYVGFGFWQRASARMTAPYAAMGEVETAVVRRDTLRVTINANGSLAPHAEVSLSFSSGGRVAEVLVVEGQQVETGQALIRLETDDLALQVTLAEIALRQAELELEGLLEPPIEADVKAAQDAVDQAEAALNLTQIDYYGTQNSVTVNETLEDAQSAYQEALHDYEYWLNEHNENGADYWYVDHYKELVDEAQLALRRARQQANQQLESTGNSLEAATDTHRQAQSDLASLLDSVDERDVKAAQLEIDQARVSLEQAQLVLEQATLTAPMAGTIISLDVEVGEMASAGEAAVLLSDLEILQVEINLDETDVSQVMSGQEVQIGLDAFPDAELAGEVTYIAPVAQVESGVVLYPVTIRLTSSDLPVRAGMTVDVDIVIASKENALIVPLRAVRSGEGQSFVLRQVAGEGEGGHGSGQRPAIPGFEEVRVTLGIMTDTEIEITGGLAEGDVVSVVAAPTQDSREFGPMRMFGGGGN